MAHFMHSLRAPGLPAPHHGLWRAGLMAPRIARAANGAGDAYEFTYQGSDGRMKATFEQAFKSRQDDSGAGAPSHTPAPWALGYQISERDLMWNSDLKARLLTRVAAQELDLSEAELEQHLVHLQALLPELRPKLPSMHPATVVQLLRELHTIPQRLMGLKAAFPGANAALLAVRAPELITGYFDAEHLQRLAAQLRELLPGLHVDLLVQENPSMLDVEELQVALAEAARIMPDLDIQRAMASDPQIILSFQRGAQLIPYDPPTPVNDEEVDDDEYAAYYN